MECGLTKPKISISLLECSLQKKSHVYSNCWHKARAKVVAILLFIVTIFINVAL